MRYLQTIALIFSFLIGIFTIQAQAPRQLNSSEIYQQIHKLNTLGTVLYVAAHPDDENTRLLSWLVGEKKYRTAYVSLTRGDGGQNLIGKELGTLLGAIRTQELLAARRVDGAEQYFTRAYDFGFSKNPEETLEKWNKDSVLKDLVVLIRKLQPDVMICRFPHTGEGGHGHHTASAILAREAFDLAADPNYLADNNLPAWKVKRLFWNTFFFSSGINTISDDQLQLEVGNFNNILGSSYGEIASNSRSQHKSQGFGSATTRGSSKEYFVQWRGDTLQHVLEGMNTSWSRIPGTKTIQKNIQKIIAQYKIDQPQQSLLLLISTRKEIKRLLLTAQNNSESYTWLKYQLQQIDQIIAQCAGVWTVATIPTSEITPNDTATVQLEWIHRSPLNTVLKSIKIGDQILLKDTATTSNQLLVIKKSFQIPKKTPFTAPYWLEQPIQNNLFQPENDKNGNTAYIYSNHIIEINYQIQGEDFTVHIPLNNRYVDPVQGEIFEPTLILPAISMSWSAPFSTHPNGKENTIQLQLKAHTNTSAGQLHLNVSNKWNIQASSLEIPALKKGDTHTISLKISTSSTELLKDTLKVAVQIEDNIYQQQLYNIEYPHIPRQAILTAAQLPLTSFPIQTVSKKIGYIEGAGDLVASSLEQIGYEIVPITEQNYPSIQWSELDAVITGIRAHNNHKWLNQAYDAIMNYVKNGGTYLVQYNTNNRIGPLVAKMFPYEIEITRDRVTVENAPVKILDDATPLLSYPNKITDEDFEDWIQERGIYFVGKKSEEWHSPFAMNDPNEPVSEGSLVWADYGKGKLIYTGLAFFRQLPASVSGAYRLFVNLLEFKSLSTTEQP